MGLNPQDLIGKTKEEANELLKDTGFYVRVAKKDGHNCMGTCDFRPERIGVETELGKITRVCGTG